MGTSYAHPQARIQPCNAFTGTGDEMRGKEVFNLLGRAVFFGGIDPDGGGVSKWTKQACISTKNKRSQSFSEKYSLDKFVVASGW